MDGLKWHGVFSVKFSDVQMGLFALRFKSMGVIMRWQGNKFISRALSPN
jgi:hypothetical protein